MRIIGIIKTVIDFIEWFVTAAIIVAIVVCILAFFVTGFNRLCHFDLMAAISDEISMISAICFCAFVLIALTLECINS